MNNFLVLLLIIFFFISIEGAIYAVVFKRKNKLATKIVRHLMKTQDIPYNVDTGHEKSNHISNSL